MTPDELHPPTSRWSRLVEADGGPLSGERLEYYLAASGLNDIGSIARFLPVPGGRRSWKSEIAKRVLVSALPAKKQWNRPRYFAAGPTYAQIKAIAWQDLKDFIPKSWLADSPSESELIIKTKWGAEIHLIGLDKPQRLEGRPWDGGWVTEYADCKSFWDQNLYPALMDRRGWAILEGTPDYEKPNNILFEQQYEQGKSKDFPEWRSFNWSTEEVQPADVIEEARRTMNPLLYQQEIDGKFVRLPNLAYYPYSDSKHRTKSAVYTPGNVIWLGCDFNHEHHNWEIAEVRTTKKGRIDKLVCFDQLYELHASVEEMCRLLKQRVAPLLNVDHTTCKDWSRLHFTGDFAGNQRRAESTSTAWQQVIDQFPDAEFSVPTSEPIADGIARVNNYLLSADGTVRTEIHEQCQELRDDFMYVTRKDLMLLKKAGQRTHASDGWRYLVRIAERVYDN
jgi:hypothetical protein